jgi:hypothetical protein
VSAWFIRDPEVRTGHVCSCGVDKQCKSLVAKVGQIPPTNLNP